MIELGPLAARLLWAALGPLANGVLRMDVFNSPTVVNSHWGAKVLIHAQSDQYAATDAYKNGEKLLP